MTDEEKKAYEELKKEINKPLEVPEDKCNTFILYNIDNAKIIVNLIENQQKEIENLLQDYKQDEKIIQEMAEYIRNIKTDYEQDYCNIENCNYHKTNCSNKCIIDYFRKRVEE